MCLNSEKDCKKAIFLEEFKIVKNKNIFWTIIKQPKQKSD